jgi:hypothetical protein
VRRSRRIVHASTPPTAANVAQLFWQTRTWHTRKTSNKGSEFQEAKRPRQRKRTSHYGNERLMKVGNLVLARQTVNRPGGLIRVFFHKVLLLAATH